MQIGPYLPARSVCGSGVWSLRIPEDMANLSVHPVPLVFPADYPHRTHCHQPLMMSGRVAPDPRTSQHIARFYNGLGQWSQFPGLSPSPALALLRLTVRVTAAVHRGFSLELSPRPLTFRHWAGVSLYTLGFPLAQTCVFVKQSPGLLLCAPRKLHQQVTSPPRGPFLPKLQGPFV